VRDLSIEPVAWNQAFMWVRRQLRENVGFAESFTFEEAVERILYTARNSSAGFAWNKFGMTKGEVLENPEALKLLRRTLSDPETFAAGAVFTMSLKDELRDIVDGTPKDARLFFPGELSLLLASVMVYGRWNDRYSRTFFAGGMGGSFLGGAADRLVRYVGTQRIGEGDAVKFDTRHQQIIREAVYSLRDELVGDHPLKAVVHRVLVSPVVLSPEGGLWQLYCGNPSGSFNTKFDNCITSLLNLAYSYFRKFPGGDLDGEVRIMTEGDDYLFGTDVDFTPDDVARYSLELGFEYEGGALRTIEEASFCQRSFIRSGGVWVCQPDPRRALATMAVNRCPMLLDLCVMSQSVMIEHFYNVEIRKLLRSFQEWAASEVGDLGFLTDDAIDRLHKVALAYEVGRVGCT
jgi:hypothetical protein